MNAAHLIVNADDFGLCEGVNRGIALAFERGIVTSASLMVDQCCARQAAQYALHRPELSVGLHLDLGEWRYESGEWRCVYSRLVEQTDKAVAVEIDRQLAKFRELLRDDPTHLDSHQHVHLSEPARTGLISTGAKLGVPVRALNEGVRFIGDFYGQTASGDPLHSCVSVDSLINIIASLLPGVNELLCHPGQGTIDSDYGSERALELETLCDPRVREALAKSNVALCSYLSLP